MKVVALVSGGKDSCYNMVECVRHGHEIVALANLQPPVETNDVDLNSFMFQTVGHEAVQAIADAMGLPLYRKETRGQAKSQGLGYSTPHAGDEVEDLYALLAHVKEAMPEVQAVASGAILSNYQRIRVENVCGRLGLVSLAFLWQRNQHELLQAMVDADTDAVLVKVASAGLLARHIGQSISDLQPHLHAVHEKYGLNVCGEGGEYETITRDCPLFKSRIVLESLEPVVDTDDRFAPIVYARIARLRLETKSAAEMSAQAVHLIPYPAPAPTLPPTPTTSCPTLALPEEEVTALAPAPAPAPAHTACRGYVMVEALTAAREGSVADEMRSLVDKLVTVLHGYDTDLSAIVRVVLVLADLNDFATVNSAYISFFSHNPPSRVCIQGRVQAPARIQLHCQASITGPRDVLHVQSISHWAPPNIGPYSQAVSTRGLVHMAGQIALDPGTVTLTGCDVDAQAELAMRHVEAIGAAMGTGVGQAKLTVCYLVDDEDIAGSQAVYSRHGVAGQVVYVGVPALPRGARVEWEVAKAACAPPADGVMEAQVVTGATIKEVAHGVRCLATAAGPRLAAIRAYACTNSPDAVTQALARELSLSQLPALGTIGVSWLPGGASIACVVYTVQ